jgi:hypothetical protein
MSFALTELGQLLAPRRQIVGVVMARSGDQVSVATPQGLVTARALSPLNIGERVLINAGSASKAPVARVSFSV